MIRWSVLVVMMVVAAAVICGCGTTPINTAGIEELYIGNARSRQLMDYGEQLLAAGRYREAYTAFLAAEQAAVTEPVRKAARQRRLWLEQAIKALERGQNPPPPPAPPKPGIFYAPTPPPSLSGPLPPPAQSPGAEQPSSPQPLVPELSPSKHPSP